MKDLILITAFCDTREKEETLRRLVNDCQFVKENFDIMIVSHTVTPEDIVAKVDYSLYDKKNELLYDWNMRSLSWFNSGDFQIFSIFTSEFNTHLAVWRLIILGNSLAKNLGYVKVHHIEYDASVQDFSQIHENMLLLDRNDAVIYRSSESFLFGGYQAYRLDTLHDLLYQLDEDKIKEMISESSTKSPEGMLEALLSTGKKCTVKTAEDLFKGNTFSLFCHKSYANNLPWCLPYYDKTTKKLCFFVWNTDSRDSTNVLLVYNKEKTYSFVVDLNHWYITDLDDYENSKELLVILNGSIRNYFKFDEYQEIFKNVSYKQ